MPERTAAKARGAEDYERFGIVIKAAFGYNHLKRSSLKFVQVFVGEVGTVWRG
jgi:hypothetical protein